MAGTLGFRRQVAWHVGEEGAGACPLRAALAACVMRSTFRKCGSLNFAVAVSGSGESRDDLASLASVGHRASDSGLRERELHSGSKY